MHSNMMKRIFIVAGILLTAIVSGNESNDTQQIEWGYDGTRMIEPALVPFLQKRAKEGYFDRLRDELFPDSACMRIEVDDKFRLRTEEPFTGESFCYANVCLVYFMLVGEYGDKSFVESFEPELKKALKRGIKTIIGKHGEGMIPYKSISMTRGDKETLRYDFYEPYDVTRRETEHSALYPLLIMVTSTNGDFTSYMLYVMSGRISIDTPYYKGVAFSPTDEKHMKKANDMIEAIKCKDMSDPDQKRLMVDIYHMMCVRNLRLTASSSDMDKSAIFGEKKTIREILTPLWKP